MIGERLAKARKSVGLSQHQLAIELGERYSQPMISMVENNRSGLVRDGLIKATQVLDISLDYLVGLTDVPTPADERVREAEERAHEAGAHEAEKRAQKTVARIRQEEARNREQLEAALERTEAELGQLRAKVAADDLSDNTATIANPDVYQLEATEEWSDITTALSRLGLTAAPWRRQIRPAAGHGAAVDEEAAEGYLVFHEWWLRKHGVREMSVVEIYGGSMDPTLKDGSAILIDHQRTRRLQGHIYFVWTGDGAVVKRLIRDDDGDWVMVSDSPDQKTYPPVPWPEDAVVRGEVIWACRTLHRSRWSEGRPLGLTGESGGS